MKIKKFISLFSAALLVFTALLILTSRFPSYAGPRNSDARGGRTAQGTGVSALPPQDQTITRAEAVSGLIETSGLTTDIRGLFYDVPEDSPYYDVLGIAKVYGIVTGVGGDYFDPDSPIIRRDLAAIFRRLLDVLQIKYPDATAADLSPYEDSGQIPMQAAPDIAAMLEMGLYPTPTGGLLEPGKAVTQNEFNRLLEQFATLTRQSER